MVLEPYQNHDLNLAMSIETSNVEQRTPKEKWVEPPASRLEGIVKKWLRLQKKKELSLD